jgi:hypothetical protein
MKKGFHFFKPFFERLASTLKRVISWQKKIVCEKITKNKKNAEFHADLESV